MEKNNAIAQPIEQSDRTRQATAQNRLQNMYRQAEGKFYFKDQQRRGEPVVAFQEKSNGQKIATSTNDERVAKSIVMAAEAKGWGSIKVSGNSEFKRAVWLEARLHGMQVKGFEPKQQDLDELKKLQEKTTRKTQERSTEKGSTNAKEPAEKTPEPPPAPVKSKENDKADVISAVAATMLKSSLIPQHLQQRLMEKISVQLAARVAAGNVPTVAMYDKTAPTKYETVERARPLVERNTQRER